MTLTEFLLARVREDEQAANATLEQQAKLAEVAEEFGWDFEYRWVMTYGGSYGFHRGAPSPTRVLAECDAKRTIVGLHSGEADEVCQSHAGNYSYEPCPTLRALATPYAGHPDYDATWRA